MIPCNIQAMYERCVVLFWKIQVVIKNYWILSESL